MNYSASEWCTMVHFLHGCNKSLVTIMIGGKGMRRGKEGGEEKLKSRILYERQEKQSEYMVSIKLYNLTQKIKEYQKYIYSATMIT